MGAPRRCVQLNEFLPETQQYQASVTETLRKSLKRMANGPSVWFTAMVPVLPRWSQDPGRLYGGYEACGTGKHPEVVCKHVGTHKNTLGTFYDDFLEIDFRSFSTPKIYKDREILTPTLSIP